MYSQTSLMFCFKKMSISGDYMSCSNSFYWFPVKPLVGCLTTSLCTGKCENLLSNVVFIVNVLFIICLFLCAQGICQNGLPAVTRSFYWVTLPRNTVFISSYCCLCYITVNILYMKRCWDTWKRELYL